MKTFTRSRVPAWALRVTIERVASIVLVVLCVLPGTVLAQGTSVSTQQLPLATCPAPGPTIAIGEVECKAGACTNQSERGLIAVFGAGYAQSMGKGLGDMLLTALRGTSCFHVIDLAEARKVQREMEATGQVVHPPNIDKLVNVDITSIELSGQHGGGGVIVPVPVPIIGGVGVRKQYAELGVDMSVLNPTTLEVDAAQSFKADSQNTSLTLGGAFFNGQFGAGGVWTWSHNITLDAVARYVIVAVANYLAHNLAGATLPATSPQPAAPPSSPSSPASPQGH